MSEETPKPAPEPIVPADTSAATPETAPDSVKPAPLFTPVTILALIAIVLVGVLIVVNVKNRPQAKVASTDLTSMQAEVDARRAELNRQRAELGLPALASGSEPIEDISKRLKKDADTLVLLTSRFQQMLEEKDTILSSKNAEILHSEQIRQSLTNECARLRSELQSAQASNSESDLLQRNYTALKSQLDAVTAELTNARQQIAAQGSQTSTADFTDLQRRFTEATSARQFFEKRVKELEAELGKLRIFAKSENELLPAAVELFRSLRQLEGLPDSDITTAYSGIGVQLGANVLDKLDFSTGSSGIAPEQEANIRKLATEVPDGDLILVVGYASKTGNPDDNQKLSSDRATAVAELISGIKRPGQSVQAVYLGQTDRFSSRVPERNQMCEIWRIRKK